MKEVISLYIEAEGENLRIPELIALKKVRRSRSHLIELAMRD